MTRRDIDIGAEGNDGTGDSIRESFRKVNENFREIYAVFGLGGTIDFTALGDTPDQLSSNTIPLVNNTATGIDLADLGSDSDLDPNEIDSVNFNFTQPGKLIITSSFSRISDDPEPSLGGPLDVGNNAIANVEISEQAIINFNNKHNTDFTVDNLVITKGYADAHYLNSEIPVKIEGEPQNQNQYTFNIDDYVNGNLLISNHGIKRSENGKAVVFETRYRNPTSLTSGETYYLRKVNDDQISLFENQEDAEVKDQSIANNKKLFISGDIIDNDVHTITDKAVNQDLPGNFLDNVAVPRRNLVRRQGDTLEGTLYLNEHPGDMEGAGIKNQNDLQAATKRYVDRSEYSSISNIFISPLGNDSQEYVSPGYEGTSPGKSFSSILKASEKAEELIEASDVTTGPFSQTVTRDNNENFAEVTKSVVETPVFEQARSLIELNLDFIVEEYIGFVKYNYPEFVFNEDEWREDVEFIVKALALDVNKGASSNSLSKKAAKRLYSTPSKKNKIKNENQKFVESIEFLRKRILSILNNRLLSEKGINNISTDQYGRPRITSSLPHALNNGDQVVFSDVNGMTEINKQSAYARKITDQVFEIYKDQNLEELLDISGFSNYDSGGAFGLVYQPRINDFNRTKLEQFFDNTNTDQTARQTIDSNINIILDIVNNEIKSGPEEIFGSSYKIVLNNGNKSFVDQGNPNNVNVLPGKILEGQKTGAKAEIIEFTNNSSLENGNDVFLTNLLSTTEFELDEPVNFGNLIPDKDIILNIEPGTYYEDFPINLPKNTTAKGENLDRTTIKPKNRTSQSKWADVYFYRNVFFENQKILEKKHSNIDIINSSDNTIEVDDTSWISVNQEIKFVGEVIEGGLQRETKYYVIEVNNTNIKVSESKNGSSVNLNSATNIGQMFVIDFNIAPFLNQTFELQGYFGRHYLKNPNKEKNIGLKPSNPGFSKASKIIDRNKKFIQEEVVIFVQNSTNFINEFKQESRRIVKAISQDLNQSGSEFALEQQGRFSDGGIKGENTLTKDTVEFIKSLSIDLLNEIKPTQNSDIKPDTSLGNGETESIGAAGGLFDLVNFAFNTDFNPPFYNQEIDIFQISDAVGIFDIIAQEHKGFMFVLNPNDRVITKTPKINNSSSYAKSNNKVEFKGGTYIDGFVGNIPATITSIDNPFTINVESKSNQGLFVKKPKTPAPFYIKGVRYQINFINEYDQDNGSAKLILDKSSNPDINGNGQGFIETTPQEIFIQTPGSRRVETHNFRNINDLGYGVVLDNGAIGKSTSTITEYCHAGFYSRNGSNLITQNSSESFGDFGLVSEGSDPNEIPDEVTLDHPLIQPVKAYTTGTFENLSGDKSITVYDVKHKPFENSAIKIDHGGSIGVLNYRIGSVSNLTDLQGVTASNFEIDDTIYRLDIQEDSAIANDYFDELQKTVSNDTFIEYRFDFNHLFNSVENQSKLSIRPSTAINFEESENITYRSVGFSFNDPFGNDLNNDQTISSFDAGYDFIVLETDPNNMPGGFGSSQGDTSLAVKSIDNNDLIRRLLRDINGNQPGDQGYQGGMQFEWKGKTHQIFDYTDDSSVATISFQDVSNTNINSSHTGTGLNTGIPQDERKFFAGLPDNSKAKITLSISILKSVSHEFNDIGTGSFNDTNFPEVVFGEAENDLAGSFSASNNANSSQVWELRKGKVFYESFDQSGFLKIGQAFTVDQATNQVNFSGDIGLTNANALGFKRGVTINEFSSDSSFSDFSDQAVPTEKATGEYINRVLGLDVRNGGQLSTTRIGPGFLSLNGNTPMEGNLNLGANKIVNVDHPGADGTAATNKNYVIDKVGSYNNIDNTRNWEINNPEKSDIPSLTGKKRIFITPVAGGSWSIGDKIGTSSGTKTGFIVDIESINDSLLGNSQIVTYTEDQSIFSVGDTIYDLPGQTANAEILEGPFFEIANAKQDNNSLISFNITRNENSVLLDAQLAPETIKNSDVSPGAEIAQSKLNLNKADVFNESNTNFTDNSGKTQSNLGLSKFSNNNFEVNEGFVRIKEHGIDLNELAEIPSNSVIGKSGSSGNAEYVSFDDIISGSNTNTISDQDFSNTVDLNDSGFPGNALIKLSTGVYGITPIAINDRSGTLVRRDGNGSVDARSLNLDNDEILSRSSTTVNFKTPGGATILNSVGNTSSSLVTKIPGSFDIGETGINANGAFQSNSSLAGRGYTATNWVYTSFIQSQFELGNGGTGIGIGSGPGFANSNTDSISFITFGSEQFVIAGTTVKAQGPFVAEQTVTFNGSIASNINPDSDGTRNIGSGNKRWDTVYANVFDGTATSAKYADLAERYLADEIYQPGYVLVFGGENEVTTTNTKGDKRVAGVVSSNPAYLMNSDENREKAVDLALQGRVPCMVLGKTRKGDLLVTSAIPGYAMAVDDPKVGTIIGKSLEDKYTSSKETIEIAVGRV